MAKPKSVADYRKDFFRGIAESARRIKETIESLLRPSRTPVLVPVPVRR